MTLKRDEPLQSRGLRNVVNIFKPCFACHEHFYVISVCILIIKTESKRFGISQTSYVLKLH